MDLFEVILNNKYHEDFVPSTMTEEELESLLASAQVSPHLSEVQNYCFVVVQEERGKEELFKALPSKKRGNDAAIVLALLVRQQDEEDDTAIVDALMATYQLALTATALGWGYNLILEFDRESVRQIIRAPMEYQIIALIPIGKPAGEGYRGKMRKMDELAYKETFGSQFGFSSRP